MITAAMPIPLHRPIAFLGGSRNQPLSALAKVMRKFPQVLINIPVREKRDLHQIEAVRTAIGRVETALAGRGRVYIRYSGTEALARVMVEGPELAQVESYASEIADAVRAALGTGTAAGHGGGSAAREPVAARA